MKDISSPVNLWQQSRLWQEQQPLGNHGHRRVVVGNLFETLTCKLLGGVRHRTDSTAKYCPDISVGDKYFECKGMGRSGSTLIYGGRLEKDARFSKTHSLHYIVWSHQADTTPYLTVEGLQQAVLKQTEWVAILPFDVIDQICLWMKPTKLNSKYGKSDQGGAYGSGYRIPKRLIEPWVCLEWKYEEADYLPVQETLQTNAVEVESYTETSATDDLSTEVSNVRMEMVV